jgi:hypothetical protein
MTKKIQIPDGHKAVLLGNEAQRQHEATMKAVLEEIDKIKDVEIRTVLNSCFVQGVTVQRALALVTGTLAKVVQNQEAMDDRISDIDTHISDVEFDVQQNESAIEELEKD